MGTKPHRHPRRAAGDSPSTLDDGLSTEKAKDYTLNFFKKWPENHSEEIYRASQSSVINQKIKDGQSFVTYLGHGEVNIWWDSWSMSNYTSSNAAQLTNAGRNPVVLGMTCLSGSFQKTCLGEAFMQKENAGAVAYIGATRESMDGADNLFLIGGNATYQ